MPTFLDSRLPPCQINMHAPPFVVVFAVFAVLLGSATERHHGLTRDLIDAPLRARLRGILRHWTLRKSDPLLDAYTDYLPSVSIESQ